MSRFRIPLNYKMKKKLSVYNSL